MKWYAWLGLLALIVGLVLLLVGGPQAQTVGLTVQWTAPGDDGTVGRASQYDLRYSTSPIVGTDTLSWWNAATQALLEPPPGLSGATDSMRVLGLQPSTTYRFIIKAADEVPNWSGYSNVAVKVTPDLIPPAAVTDLR
jgi:hypothetical protein